jgi:hypothetical protein
VGELDALPSDFSSEAFATRPALQELIALDHGAVPALEKALKTSPSWSVRASAAYALGEIRAPEALLETYHDANPVVRAFVRHALFKNSMTTGYVLENGQSVYRNFEFTVEGVREDVVEVAHLAVEMREPYLTQRLTSLFAHLGHRAPPPGEADPLGEEQLKPDPETGRAAQILKTLAEVNARVLTEALLTQALGASDPVLKSDLIDVILATLTRSDDALSMEERRAWATKLLPIAERAAHDVSSSELRYRALLLLEALAGYGQERALSALDEVAAKDPRPKLRDWAAKAAARLRAKPEVVDPRPAGKAPTKETAPAPSTASNPARASETGSSSRSLAILAGGAVILLVMLVLIRRRISS